MAQTESKRKDSQCYYLTNIQEKTKQTFLFKAKSAQPTLKWQSHKLIPNYTGKVV